MILDFIVNTLKLDIVYGVKCEFWYLQPEVGPVVLNTKGVVVGLGVVVVKHTVMVLFMVPFSPHSAVIQFPRPSVVS